jgi:hypothetical protein
MQWFQNLSLQCKVFFRIFKLHVKNIAPILSTFRLLSTWHCGLFISYSVITLSVLIYVQEYE